MLLIAGRKRAVLTLAGFCFIAAAQGVYGAVQNEAATGPEPDRFVWQDLPPLPQPVSGQFLGVHGGVLVAAGGISADQDYSDSIYVFGPDDTEWRQAGKLTQNVAFGAAVSTPGGVICAGGTDGAQCMAEVFILQWDAGTLTRSALPALPRPCAHMAAALVGNTVYVAGGQDAPDSPEALHVFWALDLDNTGQGWKELDPWPGPPRIQPVAAGQDGVFLLFGGAELRQTADGRLERVLLADACRYNPKTAQWKPLAPPPNLLAGASAVAMGPAHVLVFGGGSAPGREPGAASDSPKVLAYHTITNTWAQLGALPDATPNAAAIWEGGFVLAGMPVAAGQGSARVLHGKVAPRPERFGWLDHASLVLYYGVLIYMGFYFAKREKTTGDFFTGGGRVPWWAAGISIFATLLSAITFLAVPATSFAKDWVYYIGNLSAMAVIPLVVYLFLPFFRRLTVASAYEYLERRFNVFVRAFAGIAFIVFQLGRIGIVLLLPAIILSEATGLDVATSVAGMGIFTTIYTVMGGIEAVIWTDVMQAVVLMGGAILALILTIARVDGGLAGVLSTGWADGKFHMFNWTWDMTTGAVWVVFLGRTIETLIPYTTDQTVIQRYFVARTDRDAARAIWINAFLAPPVGLIFFGIGTALYVFYKSHPGLLDPGLRNDGILPLFIVQNFPAGTAGIVTAAVFAASMSSIASSLNSIAVVVVSDFYQRFHRSASDHSALKLARWLTLLVGVVGTGSALIFARANVVSLWENYMQIIGLFGGVVVGLFLLGIFTRRTTGLGAVAGAIGATTILFMVRSQTQASFLIYSSVGIVSCFVIGYVTSLVLGGRQPALAGLTWFTRNADAPLKDG
ncbi:MAG TPA: sodium/solute symporter [Candidatus Hydrogenedentes bacterium]|nr:sodium/solute symporter [Candidatus Hydrogenedentota bacterium]